MSEEQEILCFENLLKEEDHPQQADQIRDRISKHPQTNQTSIHHHPPLHFPNTVIHIPRT